LYAERTNLASAQRALDIWAGELKERPREFEAAWKLARVAYWLGTHGPEGQRRKILEQGVEAARTAAAVEPGKPEGPFWLAANMGALAESFGLRAGLKYRKPVKQALETVLRLDPAFQNGSADRVLGRWYFKVPGLFGGSNKQAEAHLRASLEYDQNSTITHFFLAEVLLDEGRKSEARAELQKVIDAPFNPEWAPEDDDYRARARATLSAIK
jgi:tetratricopeptide (TPR) repeat protein